MGPEPSSRSQRLPSDMEIAHHARSLEEWCEGVETLQQEQQPGPTGPQPSSSPPPQRFPSGTEIAHHARSLEEWCESVEALARPCSPCSATTPMTTDACASRGAPDPSHLQGRRLPA